MLQNIAWSVRRLTVRRARRASPLISPPQVKLEISVGERNSPSPVQAGHIRFMIHDPAPRHWWFCGLQISPQPVTPNCWKSGLNIHRSLLISHRAQARHEARYTRLASALVTCKQYDKVLTVTAVKQSFRSGFYPWVFQWLSQLHMSLLRGRHNRLMAYQFKARTGTWPQPH